jgi:hypothetical protein
MHVWTIVHALEAAGLTGIGIVCLRVGKWRLAFAPLVCAATVGLVTAAGY